MLVEWVLGVSGGRVRALLFIYTTYTACDECTAQSSLPYSQDGFAFARAAALVSVPILTQFSHLLSVRAWLASPCLPWCCILT